MTIKQMLNRYNELASQTGKRPLKVWKDKKDKLQARIDELEQLINKSERLPDDYPLVHVINAPFKDARKARIAERAKQMRKQSKKPKHNGKKVKVADDGRISVADVARDLGINPKVARAKLRRRGMQSADGRWPKFERDSETHKEYVAALASNKRASADD